jgi:hypothetical protein
MPVSCWPHVIPAFVEPAGGIKGEHDGFFLFIKAHQKSSNSGNTVRAVINIAIAVVISCIKIGVYANEY